MPTLKLYMVERRSAFVAPQLREALGLAMHIQQVDMYVVAASKAAAARLLTATTYISAPASALRLAVGLDARAFDAAGQLGEPAVFVFHHNGRRGTDGGREVLRVELDGSTRLAGHLNGHGDTVFVPAAGAYESRFEPAGD